MKILEVVHRFPPATGGCEKVVSELANEFTRTGHEVTVVTSSSIGNNDTRGFSTGRGFSLKSTHDIPEKETIGKIKLLRFPPLFQFWPYAINPRMKKWLKKHAKDFDIIHVHGYQTYESKIVSKIAPKINKPYILTAHDVIAHYGGLLGLFKKIFDLVYGKTILKNANKLIALTPENVKQYNEIFLCEDKTKIIANGIDEPKKVSESEKTKLREKIGNPEKIILFVGRIVKYKGGQYIIEALHNIIKEYPSAKAIFVGEDQGYKNDLELQAQSTGVFDNCIFTGRVPDIAPYLSIADVFAFPSHGEGFGLSPVEAMSYGVPCVLAQEGGLIYILEHVGGIPVIMNGDIGTQVEHGILKVLNGKYNLEKERKKFMRNTENYRWPQISKETLNVFKTILKEKKETKK